MGCYIHMRYAHGEIIGKNWPCSLISPSRLERLSIPLILLKIWMGKLESTPKISYHFQMMMRWKNLSIWPLTKSKRNGTNLFGIGHWYLTNLLLYLKTGFKYKTRILKFSIYTKSWTVPLFTTLFLQVVPPARELLPSLCWLSPFYSFLHLEIHMI